jgi:hypothetical protein
MCRSNTPALANLFAPAHLEASASASDSRPRRLAQHTCASQIAVKSGLCNPERRSCFLQRRIDEWDALDRADPMLWCLCSVYKCNRWPNHCSICPAGRQVDHRLQRRSYCPYTETWNGLAVLWRLSLFLLSLLLLLLL